MKFVLLFLLVLGCDKFKNLVGDIEVEDSYPISREYQLSSRQGKWNSISTEFDVKIPDIFKKKDQNIIEKPADIAKQDKTCDLFSVALDYISQKYPIKQVESAEGIIITDYFIDENGKKSQITIFAKNIDNLKINIMQNTKLSDQIRQDIVANCLN